MFEELKEAKPYDYDLRYWELHVYQPIMENMMKEKKYESKEEVIKELDKKYDPIKFPILRGQAAIYYLYVMDPILEIAFKLAAKKNLDLLQCNSETLASLIFREKFREYLDTNFIHFIKPRTREGIFS